MDRRVDQWAVQRVVQRVVQQGLCGGGQPRLLERGRRAAAASTAGVVTTTMSITVDIPPGRRRSRATERYGRTWKALAGAAAALSRGGAGASAGSGPVTGPAASAGSGGSVPRPRPPRRVPPGSGAPAAPAAAPAPAGRRRTGRRPGLRPGRRRAARGPPRVVHGGPVGPGHARPYRGRPEHGRTRLPSGHAHVDPGTAAVAVTRDRHVTVQRAERRHQTRPGEVLPCGHRVSSRFRSTYEGYG